MEARKITIYDSATQSKIVIMSEAETLGDLKKDLDKVNVNYSECEFNEGVSKSTFTNDNAILPKDLPYKGTVTNELVFMITPVRNKIKSGASARDSFYNFIKEHDLKDVAKAYFGKNYTNVSTAELAEFVNGYSDQENNPNDKYEKLYAELNRRVSKLESMIGCCKKTESKPTCSYSDDELAEMFDI